MRPLNTLRPGSLGHRAFRAIELARGGIPDEELAQRLGVPLEDLLWALEGAMHMLTRSDAGVWTIGRGRQSEPVLPKKDPDTVKDAESKAKKPTPPKPTPPPPPPGVAAPPPGVDERMTAAEVLRQNPPGPAVRGSWRSDGIYVVEGGTEVVELDLGSALTLLGHLMGWSKRGGDFQLGAGATITAVDARHLLDHLRCVFKGLL